MAIYNFKAEVEYDEIKYHLISSLRNACNAYPETSELFKWNLLKAAEISHEALRAVKNMKLMKYQNNNETINHHAIYY